MNLNLREKIKTGFGFNKSYKHLYFLGMICLVILTVAYLFPKRKYIPPQALDLRNFYITPEAMKSFKKTKNQEQKETTVIITGKVFKTITALTKAEQKRGLMFIKNLPQDSGMLFIFKKEVDYPFWMKNTYIPLTVIFINNSTIEDIKNMTPCFKKICPAYFENKKYDEALEINSGILNRTVIGQKIKLMQVN